MWRVIMFLKCLSTPAPPDTRGAWLEQFAATLLGHLGDVDSLHRASVNVPAEGPLNDWSSGNDGALELRYDEFHPAVLTLELLQSAHTLQAIAPGSLDLQASRAWLGKARPVLDKPGVRAKLIVGAQVADSYKDTEEDAQRYWRDVHPVVAQRGPEFWGRLLRYTQIEGVRTPGAVSHMPIAAEIGAASFEDLNAGFATEFYQTIVRPDELKFVKPEGMLVLASSHEKVIYERCGV